MEPNPEPSEPNADDSTTADITAQEAPATPLAPMPPIPVPPTPAPVGIVVHRRQRAGELTPGWNTAFWIGWAGVIGGLAAVWYSSRVTGFATWWLGPETAPRVVLVSLVPFLAPIALCLMALSHVRRVPWFGVVGAVITGAVAVGDFSHVKGYAVAELALATGGLLVSVASFSGLLRADPDAGTSGTDGGTAAAGTGEGADAPTTATTR